MPDSTSGERQRITIIISAEVDPSNISGLVEYLGQNGIRHTMTPVRQHEVNSDLSKLPYNFDQITDAGMFLVREHFTQFRDAYSTWHTDDRLNRLFGIFAGNAPQIRRTKLHVSPDDLGIVVLPRDNLLFPPQPFSQVNAAIHAGSLLEFVHARQAGENTTEIYGMRPGSEQERFLYEMCATLQAQIQQSEDQRTGQ